MDSFNPYDLTSAFQSAIDTARRTGECRYIVQTALGYQIRTSLGDVQYNAWKINADGSVAEDYTDLGYGCATRIYPAE